MVIGTLIGVGASVVGGSIAGVGYEVARNVIKHGYSATGAALFDIADALQIEGFESFAKRLIYLLKKPLLQSILFCT